MSASLFHLGPWRISEYNSQFETGRPSTGMVTLTFENIADLLKENQAALLNFHRVIGPLVNSQTLIEAQSPPPIPAEPVDRTVNPYIDPYDTLDGSSDRWPEHNN